MVGSTLQLLRSAVDETVMVDPADLADHLIADALIGLQAEIDRLEAQRARLAHIAHTRGIGAADGSPSTVAWLRRHTGLREGAVRAAIKEGAACDLLPTTAAAWRSGDISGGAARTILGARVEGHDARLVACEPILLNLALQDEPRELRRAAAHFRNLARADGTEPREHDGLTISPAYDGRTVMHGELSDEAAEVVTTAIHAFTDPPSDGDDRSAARRRADALVRMAEIALATLPEHADRARTRATVVIDWATLQHGAPGALDGEFTGSIHPAQVDKLLCDAPISRVVTGPSGLPLDVGRSRRTVPPPLRRAVIVRDTGCRFPGCDRPPGWCDAHHVIHWRNGGRTTLDNLVLLCDHHHHVVHRPGWIVKFDGHDLRVLRPDGAEVT